MRTHPVSLPSSRADRPLPPRPSSRSSPTTVSRHVHPRSGLHADRPPGTMLPSRCRSGTCSPSPRPTSSLISAYPGSRPLLPQRVPPPASPGGSLSRRSRHGNQERPRLQRSRRPPAPAPRVDGPSRPRQRPVSGQPGRSARLGFPIRYPSPAAQLVHVVRVGFSERLAYRVRTRPPLRYGSPYCRTLGRSRPAGRSGGGSPYTPGSRPRPPPRARAVR
jgi:hypothetical protein